MGYGYGNSSAGNPPRGISVFIEIVEDENGNLIGYCVAMVSPPHKRLSAIFITEIEAIDWAATNGYAIHPRP